MHVAYVNYTCGGVSTSPQAVLERYHSMTGWVAGLRGAGVEVTVFQRFPHDATLDHEGARYHFVRDRLPLYPRLWQLPWRLHQRVRAARPSVIHVNGLLFPLQAWMVRHLVPGAAVVAQHHAEPPMQGARGHLQRAGLRALDGFLFAARELAQPWLARGMIRSPEQVFEVMEGSTWFAPAPRAEARQRTGWHGAPLLLWVGRLDANKDPLTVLAGFERLLAQAPGARLYMIYSEEGLLPQVRARLAASARLQQAVELVGRLPYDGMAACYNSADFFVLGSHHEGSGYALAEALACGVVPIVTDIPSFRVMTNGGTIGTLWQPGDVESFARAARTLLGQPTAPHAAAARRFFEERLSFPAIGQRAAAIYHTVAARAAPRRR